MWIIDRIDEADYGCEERLPGEPLMVLVTLTDETGEVMELSVPENWLELQELQEGDEWPDDPYVSEDEERVASQNEWLDNYYQAIDQE